MAGPSRCADVGWRLGCALGGIGLISYAIGPFQAAAEPAVSENISFYDIVGASPTELVAQMHALGPVDSHDGKKVWATTRWRISWKYAYHTEGSTCLLNKVSVVLNIEYKYPRWKNEGDGDEATRSAWTRFMSALQQHEKQHGRHGLDAAREVEKDAGALKGRPTCEAVVEDVNALGHRVIKKHAARDVEFDQRTHHGRNEGIHLP
jgi:predicted secreted Zn-dependent protease